METTADSARDTSRREDPGSDLQLPSSSALAAFLAGDDGSPAPLPDLVDLASAVTSLAEGTRRKMLVPLADVPIEYALARRGATALVSCYDTTSTPEVLLLDRAIDLRALLDACADAALARAAATLDATERAIATRLAERCARCVVTPDPFAEAAPVRRAGGAVDAPGEDAPLAFGFVAQIMPGAPHADGGMLRADVHATLFPGTMWAWVRGRRIVLSRGSIMLATQRMIVAVRALVDAWQSGRPANVRLRSGAFRIGVRLEKDGEVALELGCDGEGTVTATALDVQAAALPVLRFASDLLRAVIAVDRSQSRNLRVRALREEVRALRRIVRAAERADGFVNEDPDRLRPTIPPEPGTSPGMTIAASVAPSPSALRFSERWRVEVDGLDAASTFWCGDRLVVATARQRIALARDGGDVLWAREGGSGSTWMAGTVLVHVAPDGVVELCDVADGEPFATTRIAARGGSTHGVLAGGGSIPPTAVVAEGASRLVALDLRTGEPRWRFATRSTGPLRMQRAGRVLLVACGDGALHAIDVGSGEVAWRFADRARFALAPTVFRDVVVAVSGEPGSPAGTAYGLDLYTGRLLWRRALAAAASAAPVAAGTIALVAIGASRRGKLAAIDPRSGEPHWTTNDPGVGAGGAGLHIDDLFIVNAPGGRMSALDLTTGEPRWSRLLSDPVADDVPRRLEPVLRGGALFVPAASVHVVRPADGSSIGAALPCDLVPDLIRVDERGWVYVAEESGHIAAFAPVPHLTLVRGGR